jgi:antitoxin CptB
MSGTTRTSADLDVRRRQVLYRAWHRGMREMDLIMGRFADVEIGDLSDEDLAEFERLIEVPDRDLLDWITGEIETPSNYDTSVFQRLKGFHTHTSPIHLRRPQCHSRPERRGGEGNPSRIAKMDPLPGPADRRG